MKMTLSEKEQLVKKLTSRYLSRMILVSDPLEPKWNVENKLFKKKPRWNYMDNCIIKAVLMHAEQPYERELYFVANYMKSYMRLDGTVPTLDVRSYNLDNICGGVNMIKMFRMTGREVYEKGFRLLYGLQLLSQPRLECGCYWHKAIYPHQMWLDGAYMALPFLVMYGQETGDTALIGDAILQLSAMRRIMRDEKTGLYYHGFDETKISEWADKETGLSKEFWLRSNGWFVSALADVFELTGDSGIGKMLDEHLNALSNYLTNEGMLMQLPMYHDMEGNYPETSGTLLYAYSAMKAYRLGVSDSNIFRNGRDALFAVASNYVDSTRSIPVLKNICLMGGLGGEKRRDGSAEYYLSEPIVENEAKGIAPFLFASYELGKCK